MNPDTEFDQLILNIGWTADNHKPAYPIIRMRNLLDQSVSILQLTAGYEFTWELSKQRFCPGYYDLTGAHPCPFENVIVDQDNCAYCEQKIGFSDAFFMGKEPNEHMREYLKQKHYIYLAYFPPYTIKVGTEALQRKSIRLIEQDALVGMYIAESDGFHIQDFEHAISGELGYTEVVLGKQKLAQVAVKLDPAKVKPELLAAYHKIRAHFADTPYADWLYPESELQLIDQTSSGHIYYPDPETRINKLYDEDYISGKYLGLRNKYLFIENMGSTFAFNKRYIQGRKFKVDESLAQKTYYVKPKAQPSLFG